MGLIIYMIASIGFCLVHIILFIEEKDANVYLSIIMSIIDFLVLGNATLLMLFHLYLRIKGISTITYHTFNK